MHLYSMEKITQRHNERSEWTKERRLTKDVVEEREIGLDTSHGKLSGCKERDRKRQGDG